MLKKILVGVLGLFLVGAVGVFFWARSVLAGDAVKTTLAAQLSSRLGQPVTIGDVSATVYPRVSITLRDVSIGQSHQVTAASLQLGTDFRALLSRRIEHADLHLDTAHVALPLPPFTLPAGDVPTDPNAKPAVELVSIDEIVLSNIEIVSGGRTLKGEIEIVPYEKGLEIRKGALSAGDMHVSIVGKVPDLNGPSGDLDLSAGALDFDQLIAFANDFAGGAGLPSSGASTTSPAAPRASDAAPMRVAIALKADKASMGGLTIATVNGKAVITNDALSVDPLQFGLFGGRYEGSLRVGMGSAVPTFHWAANVSDIDVAAATAFAGSPNMISGKLSGTIALDGQGADAAAAMKTVQGRARVDVTNGVVKNLGLVRAAVAATSLSVEGLQKAAAGRNNSDEPFSRIGATIALANMAATTNDLLFEAADLSLAAQGTVRLDASTIDMKGRVQLSPALTQQTHAMLATATSDQGRMTLPATITGSLAAPSVKIDAGSMAKRAIANVAKQEADKAKERGKQEVTKRLGGFLR